MSARAARRVPARPQRMVAGGVFSEDGRGRAVTGPVLKKISLAITENGMLPHLDEWTPVF